MSPLLRLTVALALSAAPAATFAQEPPAPTDLEAPAAQDPSAPPAPEAAPDEPAVAPPAPGETPQAETEAPSQPGTTSTPTVGGATVETGPAGTPPGEPAAKPTDYGPDEWMQAPGSWATFNGDLMAQKYSPATEITPENVGELEEVWEYHTGDVSDGSGEIPTTVWSATPLFVNDTLYLGTPFYRIIALEPDTGREKWSFDPDARLEALTQPAMKNRGVAY